MLLIGGMTGLSAAIERVCQFRGLSIHRIDWPNRQDWSSLEKNLEDAMIQWRNAPMLVVSHLGPFYPKFFEFINCAKIDRRPKKIYIIGSTTSDRTKTSLDLYNMEKKMLDALVAQVQQDNRFPPISLIRPGAIDTPRVRHLEGSKMSPDQAASAITSIVDLELTHNISILNIKFIRKIDEI